MRLARDGPTDGDALALTAGQLRRLLVEQFLDPEDLCRPRHRRIDLRLRLFHDPQAETHVLGHGHVRIKRVGLEHHGDATVARFLARDVTTGNLDGAGGNFLEPCNALEERGLAAAGRTDHDDEFAGADVEIDILQGMEALIVLLDGSEGDV